MKHILLVDDNTTNLKMAGQVLQPYYQVSMAKSGKQALAFLKKSIPDLILLDLLMPEMDGYQTMEEIKLNPATANIPIIFLTADKQRESEIKTLQLGALDFITKPFEEEVMLSRIEKVLMMDEMRRGLFEEADKDSSTGLYNYEYVKKTMSSHVAGNKGGALILFSIENEIEMREKASAKEYSAYLDYLHEYFNSSTYGNSMACKISDGEYMIALTDHVDETELSSILMNLVDYLSREINLEDGNKLATSVKAGSALICSVGSFDEYLAKADKAFYHVKNTDFLTFHIYRDR